MRVPSKATLVWGQGKGWNFAPYAKWTRAALAAWPEFSAKLADLSGLDVALDQSGGFEFFTDANAMSKFAGMLGQQQAYLGKRFAHEVLFADDLHRQIEGIGGDVIGATFSQRDGHVNPLRLIRALRLSVQALGGTVKTDAHVAKVEPVTGVVLI